MDLKDWEKLSPEEQQRHLALGKVAGLKRCSCLVEYDKNLFISALAAYKAEVNKLLPKLLDIQEKEEGKKSITDIIGSRLSNIDRIMKEVENTPECDEPVFEVKA